MALFESYDRRINQINAVLNNYGIKDIEEAKAICDAKGIDPYRKFHWRDPVLRSFPRKKERSDYRGSENRSAYYIEHGKSLTDPSAGTPASKRPDD